MKNIQINDKVYKVPNSTLKKIEQLKDKGLTNEGDLDIETFLHEIIKTKKPVICLDWSYHI